MAVNQFNKIASIYDFLGQLIFGKTLIDSQSYFLQLLDNESKVLILGGGSGKLLELLPNIKQVDYVEKSERMIRLAKKRKTENDIAFIHKDFFLWETDQNYDAIICPFFLDCFCTENLEIAIAKIKGSLEKGGLILVADFEKESSNKWLSQLMHGFFQITANLESRNLASIHEWILSHDFEMVDEKFFYQNMIFSRVYRNL